MYVRVYTAEYARLKTVLTAVTVFTNTDSITVNIEDTMVREDIAAEMQVTAITDN